MPTLGEVRQAKEIGKRCGGGFTRYVWAACIDCGKERWAVLGWGEAMHTLCRSCSRRGSGNASWKGGISYSNGYVYILKPEHPKVMKNGYVKRAILILEEKLGRPLLADMDSHHINGIRDDDRPENLEEKAHSEHARLHMLLIV